jgi:hypothetical protein
MPPAVKRPIPRVAFVACEPAIVVPIGWRAADPSPPITSKTKTTQSSEATPIRLKNVDAIKTPTHPISRNPTSSPSAPKTGCVTEEAIQNTAIIRARAVGPASNRT